MYVTGPVGGEYRADGDPLATVELRAAVPALSILCH
jgi:hypothetical protein